MDICKNALHMQFATVKCATGQWTNGRHWLSVRKLWWLLSPEYIFLYGLFIYCGVARIRFSQSVGLFFSLSVECSKKKKNVICGFRYFNRSHGHGLFTNSNWPKSERNKNKKHKTTPKTNEIEWHGHHLSFVALSHTEFPIDNIIGQWVIC